ncbi:thiamine biosynthesis/tRNA modification protein ThiI [Coriobacterium glomerans PW2]|uniref:Probable tRNA sulfurtransferase n=1 Tax=Coriobacterium glomerans (strain ATCC 49209 / DSM 20642 / JCM 10262 / PW2) TaxID=700015 RepID=F2N9M5_CORGP|nr:tRNA uracil 4-sulfurtransferase ThiI [Coriobacterium glomerans]AEB07128.1 thiamine biosynthesis/tRNA modification protein ThiI [Coriobacterium glomerans PW2]
MTSRVCLVHYHEVGLKGKNRAHFESLLIDTIKAALAAFSVDRVVRISGHVLVTFSDADDARRAFDVIARVPGVARVSLAFRTRRVPQHYCRAAIAALTEFGSFETFKVHARRSHTDYPLSSLELNAQVGDALCQAFPDKVVRMHEPDAVVNVLVVQGEVFVYARSERGAGGLPVGSAGKVVTLLSSGIDSPVATWLLSRRGAVCVPVHFSGRPQTAASSEDLCQDIISAYAPAIQIGRLYVVAFGDCQRAISLACPSALRVIMYRRMMYALAERVARIEGARALVTGESLGQVASQTLENIQAVDDVVSIPVLRPLIGSDKQEIIDRAQAIGTFDISCETASDCCTLFMPRRPETHAKMCEVRRSWDLIDHEGMLEQLMDTIEYVDFTSGSYRPPRALRERHRSLAQRGADSSME